MAPRDPSLLGDDGDGEITPPRLVDGEEVVDDGVDMPPPHLPESFPVLPSHLGWGSWHLGPADDGEQDHGHHPDDAAAAADDDDNTFGFNAFAAAEFLGFHIPEPTDAPVILAEGSFQGPEPTGAPEMVAVDGEPEGHTDRAHGVEDVEQHKEQVHIPHYDYDVLMHSTDGDDEDDEGIDPEMPPLMDDAYGNDVEVMPSIVYLRGVDDIRHIRLHPAQYARTSHYVIVSFSFGHTLEVLEEIRMALKDQKCESVGNFDLLAQAAQLSRLFGELKGCLKCLSQSIQEHYLDRAMIRSLCSFLPQLNAVRTSVQPPIIWYYTDAIATSIKVLCALTNFDDLNSCLEYMLERIESIDKEEISYPDDVSPFNSLPQEHLSAPVDDTEYEGDDVQEEGEDVQEEEVKEEEEDYTSDFSFLLQAEDEVDPDTLKRVSDSDNQDDDEPGHFVLIRGLSGLERIKSAPQRYSRSSYYIIESFCFGDVWDLLHGIQKMSELHGWLWVGNFELLRQVHSLRDTIGLLHRDLDRLLRDHHFDRESVTLLERFLSHLDFTTTIMQPPKVRYWVDSIAVALGALLAVLRDALRAEPQTNPVDFAGFDAQVQVIFRRMEGLDNEHVIYSEDVVPPEVLPALPGPPPLPLPSPDHSPLSSPDNSPLPSP